jgi:hypothetical protein
MRVIAERFGVSTANVQAIVYGVTWNHLTGIAKPLRLRRPQALAG